MTAFDEPRELNIERLLETIYGIQTDLKILTEQLAREHAPDLPDRTLLSLAVFQDHLQQSMPSLSRH